MKLILIITVALIAISLIAMFLWSLLTVVIGAALVYYAYKKLTNASAEKGNRKTNRNVFKIILWITIAIAGVVIIVNALPSLTFIIAVLVAIYFIIKIFDLRVNQRPTVEKKDPFEAEWREV